MANSRPPNSRGASALTEAQVRRYLPHCRAQADGVLTTSQNPAAVSFPEEGHRQLARLEDNSFWFRHRNRVIAGMVRANPPAGPVFDIGGGNGYVSRGLQEAGFRVALVEPGMDGCRQARARGLDAVVNADFAGAGFAPDTLPAVGLFDVIEHIEDDLAFLATVRQALAPGGLVYVTVPACPWLWSGVDAYSGHFRRYTRSALATLLEGAGLRPLYVSYFFQALVVPIYAVRVVKGLCRRADTPDEGACAAHAPSAAARALEAALGYEAFAVGRGWSLPFGSSLAAVAVKA